MPAESQGKSFAPAWHHRMGCRQSLIGAADDDHDGDEVDAQFSKLVKLLQLNPLGGGLFVQLSELLHDGGHIGQPLPDLRRGSPPGEVSEAPGARLSLAVDVAHLPLPLTAHDELGVVLEVVDLEGGRTVSLVVSRY